jgi:hypothetical protein
MPLPLILPSVPPALELVEVALVSAAPDSPVPDGREGVPAGLAPDPPGDLQGSDSSLFGIVGASPAIAQGFSPGASRDIVPAPIAPLVPWPGDRAPVPEGRGGAPETNAEPGPRDDPEAAPAAELEPEDLEPGLAPTTLLLRADRQVFEPVRQVITATGDVLVQFGTDQLAADRLWANLTNRFVRAEGNVFFNRNNQIIEGETITYNLLQGAGGITNARGELQISTLAADLSPEAMGQATDRGRPLDFRRQNQGSISGVTSPGRLVVATGDVRSLQEGRTEGLQRLRFETGQLFFDADGWYLEDLRLTNDPFSPPELEFRANSARLTPLNETEDELVIDGGRLVFDQGLTLPLLRRRYVLDRGQLPPEALNPIPTGIGIDGPDRTGLFVEREFNLPMPGPWTATVAPQFLVSRWLGSSNFNLGNPANFGVAASINGPLGPQSSVQVNASLSGLDLDNFEDRLRASARAQHQLGTHRLNLEYSYRDRLFNGSLGFQDVQNSLGLLLQSPNITLGNSGLNLNYQVAGQYVTANTDRPTLLNPGEATGLTSLFRFQGSADLSRSFLLWRGQPLPATATEGLRYSDRPLVPNLSLRVGLRATATYYTSDDLQDLLEGRVSLVGQVGRLQRNAFDYTQFNLGFNRSLIGGDSSPFLFDRSVDQRVLSGGVVQQIYGPFLAGFQTSINLDTGRTIDTNLIFEYRRRTYGLLISYSPTQETGFLGFRLSSFNWVGRTTPFDADSNTPSPVQVQ